MAKAADFGPIPLHVRLIQLAATVWPSKALYAAAKIGIADHLSERPASAEELAEALGREPGSLRALLGALTNFGVLSANEDRTFGLTRLGHCLRTGAPGSARAIILLMSMDRTAARESVAQCRAASDLDDAPSMQKVIELARSKRALAGSVGRRARLSPDAEG